MASIEKRTRQGQVRWHPRFRTPASRPVREFEDVERAVGSTVSPHSRRHHFGAGLVSRGQSVDVAVTHWLGHSSPEITLRVHAYLKSDDERAGRDALPETMRFVVPQGYPLCTQEESQ
jgi:integrase